MTPTAAGNPITVFTNIDKITRYLWRPEVQQPKRSQTGMWNVRYRNQHKQAGVRALRDLIAAHAP